MEREKLGSRLGFLLLSAGCAIGIGNVWRFPYVAGANGGGAFVLLYLFFLLILGIPVMSMEFSIGRASRKSIARSYHVLEKPGQKWHLHGYVGIVGNYILMMFYTTVAGWMLYYFYLMASGRFSGTSPGEVKEIFSSMQADPGVMCFWMLFVVLAGFLICSLGLQNGVEKITKIMMIALLVIMTILAANSLFLKNGDVGLKFYLLPDPQRVKEVGIVSMVVAAMNQAFFTLSIGMGSMLIFGSYLDKKHSLLGESVTIALLDTFVAIVAGLIIFPACFSFGVSPDSGPGLIFITLPNIFNHMPHGRMTGSLFFIFMSFAALSTVLAVFENIIAFAIDALGWSRLKSCLFNFILISLASLPCVFGFNLLTSFHPLGGTSTIMDLEDFLVSNLILPGGSLIIVLFCVSRFGWGFENYKKEANTGSGIKLSSRLRPYLTYALPIIILFILLNGLYVFFSK